MGLDETHAAINGETAPLIPSQLPQAAAGIQPPSAPQYAPPAYAPAYQAPPPVGAYQASPPGYPPAYAPGAYDGGYQGPPPGVAPGAPPPGVVLNAIVACRVCGTPNAYNPNQKRSCISCSNCKEATPIREAPAGKRFVICQCNQLYLAKTTASAAVCPRRTCKATTILGPPPAGKSRCVCPSCNTLLNYQWSTAVVLCPKCRQRSVVNRSRLMLWSTSWFLAGLILLAVGIGVTVGTYMAAEESPTGGFYFVMYGPIVAGVALVLRAIVYAVYNCGLRSAGNVGI